MALFNQIDFNNLFTEDTYLKAAVDGPYSIRIAPSTGRALSGKKDVEIVGILKNQINFGVQADWEISELGGLVSSLMPNNTILDALSTGINMGGVSIANSGLVTRKFFKGGGTYLNINPGNLS